MTRIRILLPVVAALLIAQAACGSSTPTPTPIPTATPIPAATPTPTVAPSPTPPYLRAAYGDDFSTNYALARADALEVGLDWEDATVYAANYAIAHDEARERGDTPEQAAAYAANYAGARAAAVDDFIGSARDMEAWEGQARAAAYAVNYADARTLARERGDAPEQADHYADAYAYAIDYGYAPDRASVYANAYADAYMDMQDKPYWPPYPYAYATAYAYATERGYAPTIAAVCASAYTSPITLVHIDGCLHAAERGDSDEEAAEYASFRASLYAGAKLKARSASVEEEPAQAFALTFSRIYGEVGERRDYHPDGKQDIASAVSTYTAAVSAGDAPERAAVYAAAYAAAIARGDAPQQAASYAAEYADANAAPTYRGESLPDMESLSRNCCR